MQVPINRLATGRGDGQPSFEPREEEEEEKQFFFQGEIPLNVWEFKENTTFYYKL